MIMKMLDYHLHFEAARHWYDLTKLRRLYRINTYGIPTLYWTETHYDLKNNRWDTRAYEINLDQQEATLIQERIQFLEVLNVLNPGKYNYRKEQQ